MAELFTAEALQAFLTVVMIDLVLAGDNAVVIGLAAAGLPAQQRTKAIMIGVLAATVLRILFALVATQLLAIVGLLFAGGVLLLWVCWKMWRELRAGGHDSETEALTGQDLNADGTIAVGETRIYDGTMFSILRPLPITTPTLALSADGKSLYLHDIGKSRIYVHDIADLRP